MTKLTPREEAVLSHLVRGLTNKGIANELSISVHTVRDHISTLMNKMAARNRIDLALLGSKHIEGTSARLTTTTVTGS